MCALPRCLPPAAAPRFQSRGGSRGRPLSGQIDRLVVTPGAVLIADYKTNRPAPQSASEAHQQHGGYIVQLALYRRVLMQLYPGRPVHAALLWTEVPELMEIPAAMLDSALETALASL